MDEMDTWPTLAAVQIALKWLHRNFWMHSDKADVFLTGIVVTLVLAAVTVGVAYGLLWLLSSIQAG